MARAERPAAPATRNEADPDPDPGARAVQAAREVWARHDPVEAIGRSMRAGAPGLELACRWSVQARRVDLVAGRIEQIAALPATPAREACLAVVALHAGDVERARLHLDDLRRILDETLPDEARPDVRQRDAVPDDADLGLQVALEVTTAAAASGSWPLAHRSVADTRDLLERAGGAERHERVSWDLLGLAALAEAHSGDGGDGAYRALRDAIAPLRLQNMLASVHATALVCLGESQCLQGAWNEAAINLARGLRLRDSTNLGTIVHAQVLLMLVRLRQGRWRDAEELVAAMGDVPASNEQHWMQPTVLAARALLQVVRDNERGQQALRLAREAAHGAPGYQTAVVLAQARIASAFVSGSWVELAQALDDAEEPGWRVPYDEDEWAALRMLAAWHRGARSEFRRRLRDRSLAEGAERDAYLWIFRAVDAEEAGRLAEAVTAARRSLELVHPDLDPLGRAWLRFEAGTALLRLSAPEGPDPAGLAACEEAVAELREVGADGFARRIEQIREVVVAALEPVRGENPLAVLTDQQRRVAELVARGYTSTEAASILHVTRKTVDFHVANVLVRLGLTSRRQIARLVSES